MIRDTYSINTSSPVTRTFSLSLDSVVAADEFDYSAVFIKGLTVYGLHFLITISFAEFTSGFDPY